MLGISIPIYFKAVRLLLGYGNERIYLNVTVELMGEIYDLSSLYRDHKLKQ